MKNFKTLVSQVEKVLQKYEKARNSDKWLTYKLWIDNYPSKVKTETIVTGYNYITYGEPKERTQIKKYFCVDDMLDLPDEQTITRIRRKFSQNKQYLATDPVILKRREKEVKIKQEIRNFNN